MEIKKKILKQTHDKNLAERIERIIKKFEEVDKSTKKLKEVFEKTHTEIENHQKLVPVEIESGNSEDENDTN